MENYKKKGSSSIPKRLCQFSELSRQDLYATEILFGHVENICYKINIKTTALGN